MPGQSAETPEKPRPLTNGERAVSQWNAADPMLLAPGLEYKLEERIAKGRQTTVFKAKNLKTGEALAVKVYSLNGQPTSDRRRRLAIKSEIQILSSLVSGVNVIPAGPARYLNHPTRAPEVPMRLYTCSLAHVLRNDFKDRGFSDGYFCVPSYYFAMLFQMLSALSYLHHRGVNVIHRKVEPHNILYHRENSQFCLTDFGEARLSDPPGRDPVGAADCFEYLPPEIYDGRQQTPKVDVWMLGMVCLMVLDVPWTSEPLETFEEMKASTWRADMAKLAQLYTGRPELALMVEMDPEQRSSSVELFERLGSQPIGHAYRFRPSRELVAAKIRGSLGPLPDDVVHGYVLELEVKYGPFESHADKLQADLVLPKSSPLTITPSTFIGTRPPPLKPGFDPRAVPPRKIGISQLPTSAENREYDRALKECTAEEARALAEDQAKDPLTRLVAASARQPVRQIREQRVRQPRPSKKAQREAAAQETIAHIGVVAKRLRIPGSHNFAESQAELVSYGQVAEPDSAPSSRSGKPTNKDPNDSGSGLSASKGSGSTSRSLETQAKTGSTSSSRTLSSPQSSSKLASEQNSTESPADQSSLLIVGDISESLARASSRDTIAEGESARTKDEKGPPRVGAASPSTSINTPDADQSRQPGRTALAMGEARLTYRKRTPDPQAPNGERNKATSSASSSRQDSQSTAHQLKTMADDSTAKISKQSDSAAGLAQTRLAERQIASLRAVEHDLNDAKTSLTQVKAHLTSLEAEVRKLSNDFGRAIGFIRGTSRPILSSLSEARKLAAEAASWVGQSETRQKESMVATLPIRPMNLEHHETLRQCQSLALSSSQARQEGMTRALALLRSLTHAGEVEGAQTREFKLAESLLQKLDVAKLQQDLKLNEQSALEEGIVSLTRSKEVAQKANQETVTVSKLRLLSRPLSAAAPSWDPVANKWGPRSDDANKKEHFTQQPVVAKGSDSEKCSTDRDGEWQQVASRKRRSAQERTRSASSTQPSLGLRSVSAYGSNPSRSSSRSNAPESPSFAGPRKPAAPVRESQTGVQPGASQSMTSRSAPKPSREVQKIDGAPLQQASRPAQGPRPRHSSMAARPRRSSMIARPLDNSGSTK